MKKSGKIDALQAVGQDLKLSITELITIIQQLRDEVDILKSWKNNDLDSKN